MAWSRSEAAEAGVDLTSSRRRSGDVVVASRLSMLYDRARRDIAAVVAACTTSSLCRCSLRRKPVPAASQSAASIFTGDSIMPASHARWLSSVEMNSTVVRVLKTSLTQRGLRMQFSDVVIKRLRTFVAGYIQCAMDYSNDCSTSAK